MAVLGFGTKQHAGFSPQYIACEGGCFQPIKGWPMGVFTAWAVGIHL